MKLGGTDFKLWPFLPFHWGESPHTMGSKEDKPSNDERCKNNQIAHKYVKKTAGHPLLTDHEKRTFGKSCHNWQSRRNERQRKTESERDDFGKLLVLSKY